MLSFGRKIYQTTIIGIKTQKLVLGILPKNRTEVKQVSWSRNPLAFIIILHNAFVEKGRSFIMIDYLEKGVIGVRILRDLVSWACSLRKGVPIYFG